jgi:hypothetical protein
MDLKPEEKIILMLAAGKGPDKTVREIGDLLGDDSTDFAGLFESAANNGVAPMMYGNLKAIDNVPAEFLERFRNAYLHSLRRNVLNAEETLRVVRALAKGGVEVIPLKGSLASELIFGDPGVYPATDIDILVRPEDLAKADAVLAEAGYGKAEGAADEDLLSSHYHFVYQKGEHFLELHWNLVKRYFHIPPEFWWEKTAAVPYAGITLNVLSPERYLLYAVFRLFDHGFRPLKFHVFVSGLIRKYSEETDWENLMSMSAKYRMERLTLFTLKLVHDLFGTGVYDGIMRTQTRGYEFFRKKILAGIFDEVEKPHLRMFLYTFLLDTPGEFIKVAARRFFPGIGEIRLRYGLSPGSKKACLFYLMNPFLVLFKKNLKNR